MSFKIEPLSRPHVAAQTLKIKASFCVGQKTMYVLKTQVLHVPRHVLRFIADEIKIETIIWPPGGFGGYPRGPFDIFVVKP